MRTEKEMFDLIIKTAEKDDRIRAVWLSGSRVHQNVPKDIFQDYDIEYVVNETKSFREDKHWIDRFGDRLYMQYPEDNVFYSPDAENFYGWLMQFKDGVRLDLHVSTLQHTLSELKGNKLYRILLDKDDCLPKLETVSDEDYWVNKPNEKEFLCACNEFWWCLNNVAKGLWREEVPYVMDMLNFHVRPMLIKLLEWEIGIENDFKVSTGKSGKYMYRWLSEDRWQEFLKTYPNSDINETWEAVFIMCDMVDKVADEISGKMRFKYDKTEADGSRSYLEHVRYLPKDAEEIY